MDKEPEPQDKNTQHPKEIQGESKRNIETARWLEAIGDCV